MHKVVRFQFLSFLRRFVDWKEPCKKDWRQWGGNENFQKWISTLTQFLLYKSFLKIPPPLKKNSIFNRKTREIWFSPKEVDTPSSSRRASVFWPQPATRNQPLDYYSLLSIPSPTDPASTPVSFLRSESYGRKKKKKKSLREIGDDRRYFGGTFIQHTKILHIFLSVPIFLRLLSYRHFCLSSWWDVYFFQDNNFENQFLWSTFPPQKRLRIPLRLISYLPSSSAFFNFQKWK